MDYSRIKETAEFLSDRLGTLPETAVILGSGLGGLADCLDGKIELPYSEIPNFPKATVQGHGGKLVCGRLGEAEILVMCGRFHYYEGHSMADVTLPVAALAVGGCRNLIVTTAVGGINTSFSPGDIMLITDHLNWGGGNPLRGLHVPELGERFGDLSQAYTPKLRDIAREAASKCNISLREGIFAYTPGPSYETPAEVRALRILGADAVSMSTVPEVIVAANAGMRVLGLACVANMAAGISERPLSHEEVLEAGREVAERLINLITTIVEEVKNA